MQNTNITYWRNILFAAVVILLVLAIAMLVLAFIFTGDTIRKGIFIEQTDISRLTVEQAGSIVTENIKKSFPDDIITVAYGERQWNFKLNEIDYKFLVEDAVKQAYSIARTGNLFNKTYNSILLSINKVRINVGVDYDRDKIKKLLEKIKNECDTTEKNAEINYVYEKVKFKHHTVGKSLDIDRNTELIENQLKERNFGIINLQIDEIKPHIMYDEIKDISQRISSFSTRFNAGDLKRSDNIRLASDRIDNKILLPGDEFSMNEALGPRTLENGYKEAPVIIKNELVEGIGGGICQVSSTLYNAVLLAGLDVTERTHHSMPLTYISPGRDATINEDSIDFRFVNNLDYPVCIQADVDGGKLGICILGRNREDGNIIKLKTEVLETYPPKTDEIILDVSLQFDESVIERKSIKGLRVVLYRETYRNGKLLWREKLTEDYYKPVQGKVRVGELLYEIYKGAE